MVLNHLVPSFCCRNWELNIKTNENLILTGCFVPSSFSSRPSPPLVFCAHISASTPESGRSSASTAGRPSPPTPPTTATSGGPTQRTSPIPAACAGFHFKRNRSFNTTRKVIKVRNLLLFPALIEFRIKGRLAWSLFLPFYIEDKVRSRHLYI